MVLPKKQKNKFSFDIAKLKKEVEKGNWKPVLESMIEAFDFDAAFYVESYRDEKGDLRLIKEPCLVNLDDKYKETYLKIRDKRYKDYLYLARFNLPINVYSHRQLYETKEYRKELKITGEYEQNAYYLKFHKNFGINDAATYGFTDPKTGIDYNVSLLLFRKDCERKRSKRLNTVVTAKDRVNIRNTVSQFPPFEKHLSEVGSEGIAKQNPLMPTTFGNDTKKLIKAFPKVITSGSMEVFIKQLMKIIGCDGGLHAQVEIISDTKIKVPVSTLVGLPENYIEVYKNAHKMNFDSGDPLLKAPFKHGFYRAYGAYDLAPKLKKTKYFESFLIIQSMDDACTFAVPDIDGKTHHFFTVFLKNLPDKKSPEQRKKTDRAFTSRQIQYFEDLMYSVCLFHGKSLNDDNYNTPQILKPSKKPLSSAEKFVLIDHAVQVEAEMHPDIPNVINLSNYIREIVEDKITRTYESYAKNQQEEITVEELSQRCPALAKWPDGRKHIPKTRKSGRPGGRNENPKEFIDRVLEEASIHGTVYLDDLREINPGLAGKLEGLAYRQSLKPTDWFPKKGKQISVDEYRKAKRLVSTYEYKKRKNKS